MNHLTFKSPYLDENVMLRAPAIISDYTLKISDVVPQLSNFLTRVESEAGKPYPGMHGIPFAAYQDDDHPFWETAAAFDLWAELVDALQDYAPPYCEAGHSVGDGACIGIFIDIDTAKEDFEEDNLCFDDPSEVPEYHQGLWLEVNDHGNVSLYHRDDQGNDTELWAVV